MKLVKPVSIAEIAEIIDAQIIGNPSVQVTHISEIHKVQRGSLIFVDNEQYFNRAIYSAAVAIIVNKAVECPEGKALLLVDKPFEAYNTLALRYSPFTPITSSISPSAKIGKGTIIEPNVVVGNHVTIGDNCLIRANTTICDETHIGNNVIIHSNTAIGNDAFYFHKDEKKEYRRWHSIGRVIIEDNVEIGAGCTIDKGVSGDTIIRRGTKIDNQVHIGHGVTVGRNCLIAAQVGIAGKTTIQDNVVIYGQVGISKSLVVGEGAVILAQTGISKSVPGDKQYFGSPAAEARTRFKEIASIRRLPEMLKKLDDLLDKENKPKQKERHSSINGWSLKEGSDL